MMPHAALGPNGRIMISKYEPKDKLESWYKISEQIAMAILERYGCNGNGDKTEEE